MDLSHIGGLFWVVIVALIFISSMKRSGKRARRGARSWSVGSPAGTPGGFTAAATASRAPAPTPRAVASPARASSQPRVRELPVMPPVLPRAEMPSPLAPHPLDLGPPRRKRSSRMPFTSRGDLVRAVIAREVLGAPLASRERSAAAFGEPYAHG